MTPWRFIPLIIFAALSFFLWRGLSLDPKKIPSVQIGRVLPNFPVKIIGEAPHTVQSTDLQGHYFLLTVWASWCLACQEEQDFLLALAREGVPIYGLSYKDSPLKAKQWLQIWGNPYQGLVADSKGQLAIELGVYGAPETFLVDSQGVIQFRQVGILDKASWKKEFLPRINHEN